MDGGMIFLGLLILGLYFIPTILAVKNDHPSTAGIILLNIFLGWTFLGWLGALIWALNEPRPKRVIIQNAPSLTKKFKCPHCHYESELIHEFCPVCNKNSAGKTLEELRAELVSPSSDPK